MYTDNSLKLPKRGLDDLIAASPFCHTFSPIRHLCSVPHVHCKRRLYILSFFEAVAILIVSEVRSVPESKEGERDYR